MEPKSFDEEANSKFRINHEVLERLKQDIINWQQLFTALFTNCLLLLNFFVVMDFRYDLIKVVNKVSNNRYKSVLYKTALN